VTLPLDSDDAFEYFEQVCQEAKTKNTAYKPILNLKDGTEEAKADLPNQQPLVSRKTDVSELMAVVRPIESDTMSSEDSKIIFIDRSSIGTRTTTLINETEVQSQLSAQQRVELTPMRNDSLEETRT